MEVPDPPESPDDQVWDAWSDIFGRRCARAGSARRCAREGRRDDHRLLRMVRSRELPRALLRGGVPLGTRLGLLRLALRRRFRPAPVYFLRVGPARVPVSQADYGVDWETMRTIVIDAAYEADYRGAVVVDVGAHKGAFGAYALERGRPGGDLVRARGDELRLPRRLRDGCFRERSGARIARLSGRRPERPSCT